ncbi:ADP-forming succinate--CoA ligase subunit beta [Bacteroidetes/Chlorobi group bacterium MS-B_bin-24]|jgi:succinyl-CoA synthetase beta subunit|nr:MAG: ADP-forming succinate--CoA ligase subunit beta [Bacteroidetes/Chlorobi group bacterium MS-B_bin-24]
MKIHEYQAKELLKKFNVPVLFNRVVFSAYDAGQVAYNDFESQGRQVVVVKAQVFAGGRGKGIVYDPETNAPVELFGKEVRGVNVVSGENLADKVYQYAVKMLGKKLVTVQTGQAGTIIRKLLLEEGVSIEKEYYAGIVLDRKNGRNTIMVSTEGGVEIEKVAEETPEKIIKEWVNPAIGFQQYQARRLAFGLGLKGEPFKNFVYFITQLVKAYEELDCSLLEINPLVLTTDGKMIALDAKMNFDDNALFRHPEYAELRDISEEDPLEVEASKYDLNYIKLDGNVGCMVNGAGLAMATMDLIQLSGGKPANFLDVGGGANVERIANAFKIMISDPNVKAVLINIFGGIVRCDKVANGIVEALKQVEVKVPVIVRLDGTNAEEGLEILRNSSLNFRVAKTFEEAAKTVTEVVSSL